VADHQDFADKVELFFGEGHDAIAHVYARLRGTAPEAELQLSGRLTGPSCLYAETLPATFSFVDRGPGNSLLAEALVPEPCFWTPDMPHAYRAILELRRQGTVVAAAERILGLRTLGSSGRKLIYDGKRWVLRGVCRDELPALPLASWREADAAMVVRNPDNALCQEASRIGVLIVAQLDTADAGEIRRLSRWPAVGIVTFPPQPTIDLKGLAHNLLLAERFEAGRPVVPSPWAELTICVANTREELANLITGCSLPVIATRIAGEPLATVVAGRTLCDRLQRDLAGPVDVSGYIV
jgi:hypothetical protein